LHDDVFAKFVVCVLNLCYGYCCYDV